LYFKAELAELADGYFLPLKQIGPGSLRLLSKTKIVC
jgi:hypothetical protein